MSSTRDPEDRDPAEKRKKKPAAKQPQRYAVQPRDMSAGEMLTLRDIVIEFGSRVTLNIHEYKKQQVWEIYADEDSLAKYIEWRLSRLRTHQAHLNYCHKRGMTDPALQPGDEPRPHPIPYPDALRHIELHILRTPMKWDQKTGREPEKRSRT